MTKIIWIAVIFFVLSVAKVEAASQYYVATTGSDTNPGSQTAPFKTMTKGVSVLVPGDSLSVIGGTYPPVVINKSGTASAPITITGDHAMVSGGSGNWFTMNVTGSYLVLGGFEVTQAVSHGVHISGQHIKLSGFSIHDNVTENRGSTGVCAVISGGGWGSGLSVKLGTNDIQISNSQIYNNCGEGMAATQALNVTVTGVTSYDNFSANLYVDNSKNITLDKNFVYCTSNTKFYRGGLPATGLLIGEEYYSGWGAQLENVTFTNNISYGCRGINFYGAQVSPAGLAGALIAHNTVWMIPNSGWGVNISSQPNNSNIRIVNNIVAGSISTGTGITASNNQTTAIFASTPGFDPVLFRTTAISPGVNAGVNAGVTTDFFWNARDMAPDIGAIELVASGTSPTPTARPTSTPTAIPTSTPIPMQTPSPTPISIYDLNGDGKVDGADVKLLLGKIAQPLYQAADYNHDGKVNGLDFEVLVNNL